jgi:hypothetical protein
MWREFILAKLRTVNHQCLKFVKRFKDRIKERFWNKTSWSLACIKRWQYFNGHQLSSLQHVDGHGNCFPETILEWFENKLIGVSISNVSSNFAFIACDHKDKKCSLRPWQKFELIFALFMAASIVSTWWSFVLPDGLMAYRLKFSHRKNSISLILFLYRLNLGDYFNHVPRCQFTAISVLYSFLHLLPADIRSDSCLHCGIQWGVVI